MSNIILQLNEITNITIDTTTKISPKHIKSFLKTNIELNDITLDTEDRVFYRYISEVNIYEIYIINKPQNDAIFQFEIFKELSKNHYELFVTTSHIIIYKDNKFYFFKENKGYKTDDILQYIKYQYKIDKINIQDIDNIKLTNLEQQYFKNNSKSDIKYINIQSNNNFYYYIIFLITLIVYASLYIKEPVKPSNTKTQVYRNNYKIETIVKDMKTHNLEILSIVYNGRYQISFKTEDKKSLDKFMDSYKLKSDIKLIHKNKKLYIWEIDIVS